MEKEQQNSSGNKMCDWCGNEYGRKYSWLRLIVGILIGWIPPWRTKRIGTQSVWRTNDDAGPMAPDYGHG